MNLCFIENFCRSSDSEVLWFPLRGRTLAPEITIPPGGCSRETRQTRVTAVGTIILQGDTACSTLLRIFRLRLRPSCTLNTETASTSSAWLLAVLLSLSADTIYLSITQHQTCYNCYTCYSAIMLSINSVRAADGGCSRARLHSDWQNCRISPAAHCHIAAAPPRTRHNILSDGASLPLRLIATPATAPWIHLCLTFISLTTF